MSTGAQATEGISLSSQEALCRAHTLSLGYTVDEAHIYREVHTGAELWERLRLTALHQAARAGEVGAILAREQGHVYILDDECQRVGAVLLFVTADVRDPGGNRRDETRSRRCSLRWKTAWSNDSRVRIGWYRSRATAPPWPTIWRASGSMSGGSRWLPCVSASMPMGARRWDRGGPAARSRSTMMVLCPIQQQHGEAEARLQEALRDGDPSGGDETGPGSAMLGYRLGHWRPWPCGPAA